MRLLAVSICLFLAGCANIGAPSGGPKDEMPPKMIRAIPANGTTHFDARFITLVFDEFIQLKNPSEQILVSPNPPKPLEYKVNRKTLHITLPDSLPANTTFTIGFGDALVDLNEGNPIPNFQYVFSTGDFLDSLTLSGRVIDFRTKAGQEGFTVALYENTADSVVFTERPFYLRKTSASGNFDFDHLKQGTFKIVAFKDENGNLHYDPGTEPIGFLDSLVTLPASPSLNIATSKPYPDKITLTNTWRTQQAQIWGALNRPKLPTQQIKISITHDSLQWNRTRDTFSCWLDTLTTDNVEVPLVQSGDTLGKRTLFGLQYATIESFYKNPVTTSATQPLPLGSIGLVTLKTSTPIKEINPQHLNITKDSLPISDSVYSVSFYQSHINILFNSFVSGYLSVMMGPTLITDIYNRQNDADTIQVKLPSEDDYGSLKIAIDSVGAGPIIVQLTNQKGNPIFQSNPISKDTTLLFPHVLPGTYHVQAFRDLDQSGFWTPAHYPSQFPEPFYVHPEALNIRSNWELNVDLKPEWVGD